MDITQDFLSKINSKRILVITGNKKEFDGFIDEVLFLNSQFDLYDGYEFINYTNEDSIRGMRFKDYVFYGTGGDRTDINMNYVRASIKS